LCANEPRIPCPERSRALCSPRSLVRRVSYCLCQEAASWQYELADLFKGFNFFVAALVACLIITIFTFVGSIFCIIPGLVVGAIYMFSYLFIVDKRMDFWPAMQASYAIVKNDYFGFTLFFVALLLLNILGVICCVVGVLVTMPIFFAAV